MEVIIDGIRHCPVTDLQTNIDIAITTHNRPAVLAKTIEQHLTHLPAGAKLIVIDDGSAPAATAAGIEIIRHEKSLGIVASKNRSIEELIDADKRRSDYITIDRLIHGVCYSPPVSGLSRIMQNWNRTKAADYAVGDAWGGKVIYPCYSLVDHADGVTVERHPDNQPRMERRRAWRLAVSPS